MFYNLINPVLNLISKIHCVIHAFWKKEGKVLLKNIFFKLVSTFLMVGEILNYFFLLDFVDWIKIVEIL